MANNIKWTIGPQVKKSQISSKKSQWVIGLTKNQWHVGSNK